MSFKRECDIHTTPIRGCFYPDRGARLSLRVLLIPIGETKSHQRPYFSIQCYLYNFVRTDS